MLYGDLRRFSHRPRQIARLRRMAWTAKARAAAAAATKRRIEAHDAECLPLIRSWRARGTGWRRLARLLTLYEKPPPGGCWTPEAVRRIAARHGVD